MCKKKTAKGPQSRGPSAHPSGFFKEFLVVDEGRVLTCVCMLGYWMWDAVPIWFLYASVLIVGHCADLVSVCFGVGCGTLCRGGCSGTVMRFSTCDARLRGYSCFRLPYFGSVLNCQYRSIQVQVSIFQHSTVAALYKKGPGVCRGARPCAPLRFSHIPM